ncbi:hypothetical protein B0H14DRAFT_3531191 [Mycena olivaceomarginata]|nr:hypothetical protein B0H14DRAFT_3531191 [Mycena olivaceomarginata]
MAYADVTADVLNPEDISDKDFQKALDKLIVQARSEVTDANNLEDNPESEDGDGNGDEIVGGLDYSDDEDKDESAQQGAQYSDDNLDEDDEGENESEGYTFRDFGLVDTSLMMSDDSDNIKVYEKKFPEQAQRLAPKRTGCACALIVKQYPGTRQLLGLYKDDHNHPLKKDNIAFTHIPRATREYIATKLRDSVQPNKILKDLHQGAYLHDAYKDVATFNHNEELYTHTAVHTDFIQLRDVCRI